MPIMFIGLTTEINWDEKLFLLALTSFLCCISDQTFSPECVRYELHESSNTSDVIKSLTSNCVSKKGDTVKYSSKQLSSWPTMYNVTFECCSNSTCIQDIECPFNFNCDTNQGRCLVSDCELSDQIDHVLFEGTSCSIHEDCAFFVPFDYTNWKCVLGCNDSIDGCATCQRCPNNHSSTEPWSLNIDLPTSPPSSSSSFSTEGWEDVTLENVTSATSIDTGSRNDV